MFKGVIHIKNKNNEYLLSVNFLYNGINTYLHSILL